jgi:hypothetical protein
MAVLVVVGIFIFPMTQLLLRLIARPVSLPKGHPMNALAMQVAFVLPLSLPLVFAATAYRETWFYPAFMIALGAHYLPFIFLYGMWQFGVLAGFLLESWSPIDDSTYSFSVDLNTGGVEGGSYDGPPVPGDGCAT